MIRPSYNYPALRLISGMFQLVCVAAVLASAGCGSGDMTVPTDALSGDLNKAISLSETKSDAGKTQVLVYCVNEPNAAAYAQIRDWLREEGGEEFVRVADWIEGDLERFPNAVDQELSQIRQHAPLDTGVAIVSNALLREGRFLQKPAGSGEYVSVPFKATESGELLPHPVTDPAVFAKIIDQLAATFPPENHEFNLITKSHGSDEFAMATSMGQVLDVPSK
jgi:hypothetical protein